MKDLGELQRGIWIRIREAVRRGDGSTMHALSQIADDMDRKYDDWLRRSGDSSELPRAGSSGGLQSNSGPSAKQEAPSNNDKAGKLDDYTGRTVYGFEFDGTKVSVGTWKEVLLELTRLLREKYGQRFDSLAPSVRGHLPYFSEDPNDLRKASRDRIGGGKLYVETNLNTNLIVEICYELLDALNEDSRSLKLDASRNRTRAVKRSSLTANPTITGKSRRARLQDDSFV